MPSKSAFQSLKEFFKRDDGADVTSMVQLHQNHSSSEFLASINIIRSELHKFESTGTSLFTDIRVLKTNAIPDAITLCEYATNIALGNPIDDSLLEMEKIIVLLYSLPSDSQIGAHLSKIFIGSLWKQLPHPPASFQNKAGYQWRSADGSGNNLAFPTIGKSGEKFIQGCLPKRSQAGPLPDPGLIFDKLLRRSPDKNGRFKASESRISSNLFYFATLITHDLFNTDAFDKSVNKTTSYLDLSPLYGWTHAMRTSVRAGIDGLLKPDQFADDRFWIQPPGVTALIVLFCRNHNYLAERLLRDDQNVRFSSLQDQQRDEALFQTARLINERTYASIILHDYLRVILGVNRPESTWTLNPLQDFSAVGNGGNISIATGNQCSLEFNFLYRWHHATSLDDESWLDSQFSRPLGDWETIDAKTMLTKAKSSSHSG